MKKPAAKPSKQKNAPEVAEPQQKAAKLTPEPKEQAKPKNEKKEPEKTQKAPKAKTSPKAKAKGKALAKAKGKALAKDKAQAVKKTIEKSKGKSKGQSKGKGNTTQSKNTKGKNKGKKPASGPPKQPSADDWKEGLLIDDNQEEQPEEESPRESDDCVCPNDGSFELPAETKDRSKNNKFLKLLQSGALPEWLRLEWERISKLKTGRTEAQRRLVNGAVDRDAVSGKLALCLQKPMFRQLEENYTKTVSRDRDKTLPKTLLMGKFNLSPEMFENALAEGDIVETVNKSGKKVYAWSADEHVIEKGKQASLSLESEKKATATDKNWFAEASKDWKIGLFQKGSSNAGSSSSSTKVLAIQDRVPTDAPLNEAQWKQAQTQLSQAMASFDRLLAGAKKLIGSMGVEMKDDELYKSTMLA
ncbi:unnamed protein product [Symbiodinium natans]|uniref:Uncharacterized protein n=1 Tax=Symbiodinium natans TaxID=878477 RepID=A0A812U9C2_9DINO|nr:unnamed protein product [Symbiodinium natans]